MDGKSIDDSSSPGRDPVLINPAPIARASLTLLPFLKERVEHFQGVERQDPSLLGPDVPKEVTSANLKWMLEHLAASPELPIDKQGRWIGFIQGVLAARGVLSVSEERDRTRGVFHEAYRLAGLAVPGTASMPDAPQVAPSMKYDKHLEPAVEKAVAPYMAWIDSGYASGVVDLLPRISASPFLTSQETVGRLFEATLGDLDGDDETSRSEAEARMAFAEKLLMRVMERENELRDRYYRERARGMLHRTAAVSVALVAGVAAMLVLPGWASTAVVASEVAFLASLHVDYSKAARAWTVPEDRAAALIAALPWRNPE